MARKTLGYVELEWTCPQCGTRNPGPHKFCSGCGKPQPKNVEFHQAAEEELITDQQEIARAQAGPDVHCGFCGARNVAGAERCTQCGAQLVSATARQSGAVMGAHREGPAAEVKCPRCGALNEATALRCTHCNASLPKAAPDRPKAVAKKPARKIGLLAILGIGLGALVAITACVLIILSLIPGKEVVGQVQAVSWTRSIEIQQLSDVTKEGWADEIPSSARRGACADKVRRVQDEPAANAKEICGTPYTVDKGTGHGEVVQDCRYEVYDDWCQYTVQEWRAVDEVTLSGSDMNPQWPDARLAANQREGQREEVYKVVFAADDRTYTHTVGDLEDLRQYQVGSRWALTINKLGGIRSVEPAR